MAIDTILEQKLDLTLRGLHLLIRATFAPNDEARRMKHLLGLQNDIAPWLQDYVHVMDDPTPQDSETGC